MSINFFTLLKLEGSETNLSFRLRDLPIPLSSQQLVILNLLTAMPSTLATLSYFQQDIDGNHQDYHPVVDTVTYRVG